MLFTPVSRLLQRAMALRIFPKTIVLLQIMGWQLLQDTYKNLLSSLMCNTQDMHVYENHILGTAARSFPSYARVEGVGCVHCGGDVLVVGEHQCVVEETQ